MADFHGLCLRERNIFQTGWDHQVVNWFAGYYVSIKSIGLRQHYSLKERFAVTTARCLLRVLERLLSTKKALPHGWQWWLERHVTGRGWTFQDLGQDLVVVSNIVYCHPCLRKMIMWDSYFSDGWFNHQLEHPCQSSKKIRTAPMKRPHAWEHVPTDPTIGDP